MSLRIRLVLAVLALALTCGPYVVLDAAGGRAAMNALTGEQIDALVLALPYFASWVWLVFAGPPVAVGCLAWLAVRSRA